MKKASEGDQASASYRKGTTGKWSGKVEMGAKRIFSISPPVTPSNNTFSGFTSRYTLL